MSDAVRICRTCRYNVGLGNNVIEVFGDITVYSGRSCSISLIRIVRFVRTYFLFRTEKYVSISVPIRSRFCLYRISYRWLWSNIRLYRNLIGVRRFYFMDEKLVFINNGITRWLLVFF